MYFPFEENQDRFSLMVQPQKDKPKKGKRKKDNPKKDNPKKDCFVGYGVEHIWTHKSG
jgi:hypothetical protein